MRLRDGTPLSDDELVNAKEQRPIYIEMEQYDRSIGRPHLMVTQYADPDPGEWSTCSRLAYFDVCRAPDWEPMNDPIIGTGGLGRIQASDPGESRCIGLAKEWLDMCSRDHQKCRLQISHGLPTRVLHVTGHTNMVQLVSGDKHSGQYAALSYCWGGERGFRLLHCTQSALYSGVSLSVLPATLRDAVRVTRSLELGYLWIDAICIQQDDPQDWAREAARMSEIYKGAAVTLEIASASRPSEGFLKPRKNFKPYVELEWRQPDPDTITATVQLRPIDDMLETQLKDTHIFSRGWTLQERVLAPRTLSFGEQQISYECVEGFKDEADIFGWDADRAGYHLRKENMHRIRHQQKFPFPWIRMLLNFFSIPDPVNTYWGKYYFFNNLDLSRWKGYGSCYEYWNLMVERFSRRELTVIEDRLPALSGFAKEIQKATKDAYCAGHWRSQLLDSLAWQANLAFNPHSEEGHGKMNKAHDYPTDFVSDWPNGLQSPVYVAPSWSWASVRTSVTFSSHKSEYLARILDVRTVPKYRDPFGSLDAGHLDISGPFLRIPTVLLTCESTYPYPELHAVIRGQAVQAEVRRQTVCVDSDESSASEFYQHHREHANQQFAVLKILRWRDSGIENWLLVESCGDGTWRRLCLLQIDPRPYDWSEYRKRQIEDIHGGLHKFRHSGFTRESVEAHHQARLAQLLERGQEHDRLRAEIIAAPFRKETIRLT